MGMTHKVFPQCEGEISVHLRALDLVVKQAV